ncbi:MAG: haloacid dehalogenase-like hydrolase, partial [Methylobacter sp.]
MNRLPISRIVSYCYRMISLFVFLSFATAAVAKSADPLPSWNNGPAKTAIVHFVKDVTKKGG